MSLCLDTSGSARVTPQEIALIPLPERTRSYAPIHHLDILQRVTDRAQANGLALSTMDLGIAREGRQFFASLTFDGGDDVAALSIGVRNSYDKSLSVGVATGSRVFVCSNLCFSGSGLTVMRKHTTNVSRDLDGMLGRAIGGAERQFEASIAARKRMAALPMSTDDGYAALGRLLGAKLLSPTQATVAFAEWRQPRHADFEPRNAWSLYNAVTEGLKKGGIGSALDRYTRADAALGRLFAVPDPAPMLAVEAPRTFSATLS